MAALTNCFWRKTLPQLIQSYPWSIFISTSKQYDQTTEIISSLNNLNFEWYSNANCMQSTIIRHFRLHCDFNERIVMAALTWATFFRCHLQRSLVVITDLRIYGNLLKFLGKTAPHSYLYHVTFVRLFIKKCPKFTWRKNMVKSCQWLFTTLMQLRKESDLIVQKFTSPRKFILHNLFMPWSSRQASSDSFRDKENREIYILM